MDCYIPPASGKPPFYSFAPHAERHLIGVLGEDHLVETILQRRPMTLEYRPHRGVAEHLGGECRLCVGKEVRHDPAHGTNELIMRY